MTVLNSGHYFDGFQYAVFHISPTKQHKAPFGILALLNRISVSGWIMVAIYFECVALTFIYFKLQNPVWNAMKILLETDIDDIRDLNDIKFILSLSGFFLVFC